MIFELASEVVAATTELAMGSYRTVTGRDIRIPPRLLRQLITTFDASFQGRIPRILGDDEQERVDNLKIVLRGASERDLNMLISDLQRALAELDPDRQTRTLSRLERCNRREDRDRRRRRASLV